MKRDGIPPIKIRKAKQNWLDGKKEIPIHLQIQQRPEAARKRLITNADPSIKTMFEPIVQAVARNDSEINEELLQTVMKKTKEVIDRKKQHIPSIASWLTLLLNDCRTGSAGDLIHYLNLIGKLNAVNDQIVTQWIKVHTALAENGKKERSGLLFDVQKGLEKHSTLLNSIVELYRYKPYPNIQEFVLALEGERKKLKSYIETFDRDPWQARAPKYNAEGKLVQSTEYILEQQFDTSQVQRVIAKIRDTVNGEHLTAQLQYELAQQVTYINAIGKEHPLLVRNKTYTDLTRLSRLELRELSTHLIALIRAPIIGEHTKLSKLKAQLNLLAVMREQYFRVTGQFIDSTQIASILLSLNYQQYNILIEIEPEEKRKMVTQLCAVMLWADADGGSVEVCVSNRNPITNDYIEQGAQLFFTALDIPSEIVRADDFAGTYQVDGINYTTIADLALYRSRAQKEDEGLSNNEFNKEPSSKLIMSGQDFSTFNNRTVFDLLANVEQSKSIPPNPYEWIYPLINEFINQEEFKNRDVESEEVWDEEQDLVNLKFFLKRHTKVAIHQLQLANLSDTTLNSWINLACRVQQLVEGEDFIVDRRQKTASVAVPVYLKIAQETFSFSYEMQHFLYSRLQKQYPTLQFTIHDEREVIDSVSAKGLFDFYKYRGRIMAIFGKSGMRKELTKQGSELNIKAAVQVPSHDQYQREELDCHNLPIDDAHLKKIKSIIAQAQAGQPIVLLVQDAYQVEKLFQELSRQFAQESKEVQLGAFTGDESEGSRKNWVEQHAGQANTITIATASLIKGLPFNSDHNQGFLGVHTYCESPTKTRKFIEQVVPKNKPGQYVVIYDEDRIIRSNSWSYQQEQEKDSTLIQIAKMYRKKSEEIAIERYYTQALANIKSVVLQQIDEWQAFLHLLYPQKQWKKLDGEILVLREELLALLDEEWGHCLENSDPKKAYFNPYIRRDNKGKLQTLVLDKTLKEYERIVALLWQGTRDVLKEKTTGKILKDSINALRCDYLERVSLEEQLKVNKLAERQKRKTVMSAKKKMKRSRDFGLDVNGAMLAYSDVPKEDYRMAFAKNQIRFLVAEMTEIVESSSLSASSKTLLYERLKGIDSFLAIASFLSNYFTLFDSDHLAERYRMQPVINELFRIYEYSGLQLAAAQDLEELRDIYVHNVAFDVVNALEQNLSWALEENRGWGIEYWLERTAVKKAAHDLLAAIDAVKSAIDTPTRKVAIKNLYTLLTHHQAQLDELWIFSFGHKNTRDVINQTLKTLNTLTVIGSGYEELDVSFIQECQEEAYSNVMNAQFNAIVEQIEHENDPWLKANLQWKHLRQQLSLIQSENKTVYSINDLYYFLSRIGKELNLSGSSTDASVFKLVIELRGSLRTIWDKFYQDHQEMISDSKYLKNKAQQLKGYLHNLLGYQVEDVAINRGHNGVNEYFDLVIEGEGAHPLLNGFLTYNSQLSELEKEHERLVAQKKQLDEQTRLVQQLRTVQLPEFCTNENSALENELFPTNCQEQLEQLNCIKSFLLGMLPKDLSSFSQEEQSLFHDRDLVKNFEMDCFDLEQIEQLKDKKIKADLIKLYNKINEGTAQQNSGFFSKIASLFTRSSLHRETRDDWAYQLTVLKATPANQLKSKLQQRMDVLINAVSAELHSQERSMHRASLALGEKINFLQQKINEERNNSNVISKRFTTLDKLCDFEIELRNYRASHCITSIPSDTSIQENAMPLTTVAANEEHVTREEEPTMRRTF